MHLTTPDKETIQKLPFFFILGRPRSGTTLMRMLFDAHPNVLIPIESTFILSQSFKYKNKKKWSKSDLEEFYDDLIESEKVAYIGLELWNIDYGKLKNSILSLEGKTSYETICKAVYLNYISNYQKSEIQLIGDKTPPFANYPKKIFKIFPNAKYIHLIRDYRDHLQSVLNVDFGSNIPPIIAYYWQQSIKKIQKLKNKYPEQFYTIRHEDFVASPKKHLSNICSFLNIPYKEKVFDFRKNRFLKNTNEINTRIDKNHKSLKKPINTEGVFAWKKTMDNNTIKIADFIVGKYAEIAGYEKKYKTPQFSIVLKYWPFIIYAKVTFQIGFLLKKIQIISQKKLQKRGPRLAEWYWQLIKKE